VRLTKEQLLAGSDIERPEESAAANPRASTTLTPKIQAAYDNTLSRGFKAVSHEEFERRGASRPTMTLTQYDRLASRRASLRARQGRARRVSCNARSKGSRRRASARAPDDPDPEPEPRTGLKFWRHPKWGDCTPNLLALLLAPESAAAENPAEGV
jgi:hypothetical protein